MSLTPAAKARALHAVDTLDDVLSLTGIARRLFSDGVNIRAGEDDQLWSLMIDAETDLTRVADSLGRLQERCKKLTGGVE